MSLGFVADDAPETVAAGHLTLTVGSAAGRTFAEQASFGGVLRLMKPHYLDDSGQATYLVLNPGGAYFPEEYDIALTVRDRASLLLATQGATRVHRTNAGPAVQRMSIRVEGQGRLEYVPDSLIAYHDSRYRQLTQAYVDPGASIFMGEIITPGWHESGAEFTYSDLHLRTTVKTNSDDLVCIDNLRITPPEMGDYLIGIGYLEGFSHLGGVLIIGPHATSEYADELRDVLADFPGQLGVTSGAKHGLNWVMARALGSSTDDLRAAWQAANTLDRSHTTGQGPLDLRRY